MALVQECLGDFCEDYGRVVILTGVPVADCATVAISIGNARAVSGSCVGKLQLRASLDIHLIRCCEPVGTLTSGSGYIPPTSEEIQAAAACLVRDAWAIYQCLVCTACDTVGAVPQVDACCDDQAGAPEIRFGSAQGGCRTAVISVPLVFTTCCEPQIGL